MMGKKRDRVIVAEQNARVFFVKVGKLWEEDTSAWASQLFQAGQKVRSIRKVMHESRGVIRVEFSDPTDMSRACQLLEADAEATGSPVEGKTYKVTKTLKLRPAQSGDETPLEVTKGASLVFKGQSPDQYLFDVKGGDRDGRTVSVSMEEWEDMSSSLEAESDANVDSSKEDEEGEEGADEADSDKDTGEDEKDREKRLNTHLRVRRSFPKFPQRKNLSDYLTPDGKALDKKVIEKPEGGGGGGGGFGGF